MKTSLTILVLFLSIHFAQAQTSVYQPYPLDNASWTMHTQYYDGSGLVQNWATKNWSGDTVIGGQTYIRVFDDPSMIGVRQDVPNEKIYYIDDLGVEHDASFGQSAQPGDTVLLTAAFKNLNMFSGAGSFIVDDMAVIQSVDSTIVGPIYHKVLTMNVITSGMFFEGAYICGVSCTSALTSLSSEFDLTCYYVEGQQYLGNPLNPYCTAGVEELTEEKVRIYPNPSKEVFFIESDKTASLLEINLLDLTGKRVSDFNVENAEIGFDISKLPTGAYLVELVFENGISRSTLIKE